MSILEENFFFLFFPMILSSQIFHNHEYPVVTRFTFIFKVARNSFLARRAWSAKHCHFFSWPMHATVELKIRSNMLRKGDLVLFRIVVKNGRKFLF